MGIILSTLGILVAIAAAGLLWFGLPHILRKLETRQLAERCRDLGAVALTYDDGPNPTATAELLDLLDRYEVKATFFLIGDHAQSHPALLERMQAAGHQLASHTDHHTNAWKTGPFRANADTVAGRQTLTRLGVTTDLFRPPFGKTTLATLFLRLKTRLRFAWWTVDTRDSWARRPGAEVIAEIKSKGGGVILMHDVEAPKRGPAPELHIGYMLDLTKQIIEMAQENNFRLMRYDDLYNVGTRG